MRVYIFHGLYFYDYSRINVQITIPFISSIGRGNKPIFIVIRLERLLSIKIGDTKRRIISDTNKIFNHFTRLNIGETRCFYSSNSSSKSFSGFRSTLGLRFIGMSPTSLPCIVLTRLGACCLVF